MNKVALSGSPRTQTGTKYAAQLRRDQRVPCVLYGGGSTVHFSVDEAELKKIVFTPEMNSIELDIEGNKTLAMVQEKQFHPTSDRVTHVDFIELKEDREARVLLSVRLNGQPAGVREGGKLSQIKRKLLVKGLPANIPQHLDVDVTELKLNGTVHVNDLKYKGITFLERPMDVVASVKLPKKVEEAVAVTAGAPAAGAAAPAAGATPAAAPAAEAKPAAKK